MVVFGGGISVNKRKFKNTVIHSKCYLHALKINQHMKYRGTTRDKLGLCWEIPKEACALHLLSHSLAV